MKKTSYSVIGVMAGSSMDGLDIAKINFVELDGRWRFEILSCITLPYDEFITARLSKSPLLSKQDQDILDNDFGIWIAKQIGKLDIDLSQIDLLAIHGHTVIHEPENGISWQLGKGRSIADQCKIPTITDFRSKDIKLGGQGAPLVPLGDFQLFSKYDACINLGGISNISIKENQTAWDICPCNQVLNYFANQLNTKYDEDGQFAKKGKFDLKFYNELMSLDFFQTLPPKSLPNGYISLDLLDKVEPLNGLNTFTHFIAKQIGINAPQKTNSEILITGGGAHNSFLVDLISKEIKGTVVIPLKEIVDFKEAIIFGFLGLKRHRNEINVLSSVTGGSKDSCSGVIHLPE